jgi:DNA-binding HxlR family transcriptional regulator
MTENADQATDPAFAQLLDLIGRRWTLRILWELRTGPLAFNELRKRAGGLSQSVLVTRLTELFGAGLVADVAGGYELTPHGATLAQELGRFASWSAEWARER